MTGTKHPWGPNVLPEQWDRSYWQQTVDDPMLHRGRDAILPSQADVVVIGSGLPGAMTAYHLLSAPEGVRPGTVVCLEARETCSGATGRNGGHCRPDAFRGFADYAKVHGAEEAKKIVTSERKVLELVETFVERYKLDCELKVVPTMDVIMGQEFERYVDESFADARNAGVNVDWVTRLGPKEARELSQCPAALGAYTWRGASLHSLKLVLAIHRINLELGGYDLFTHCPVTAVTAGNSRKWSVHTYRGNIEADKVVYATNAYTKLVLPEMDGLIRPWAIQATTIPTKSGPEGRLAGTMSLRFTLDRFYGITQQVDGSLITGNNPDMPLEQDLGKEENMDDSKGYPKVTEIVAEAMAKSFPQKGISTTSDAQDRGWSGVVALTPDKVPYVGEVPGKDGQYIIAGMGAHGMARIFHCAPTVATLMLGGEWDPELPSCFRCTPERLARLHADAMRSKAEWIKARKPLTRL